MPDQSGSEPVKVQLAPVPWQSEIWDMVRKQGAAALILGVGMYYFTTWVAQQLQWAKEQIPIHLQAIKEGYREVTTLHLEARKEAEIRHNEAMKEVVDSCKDALDRQERILTSRININARKTEEVAKKTEEVAKKVDAISP